MIMACLQIYQPLLSLETFHRVHSNSKEVSNLSWQNACPNLKTTCHIKLNIFLWTKLLEKLLLAKYLIFVAAPLKSFYFFARFNFLILSLATSLTLMGLYLLLPTFFKKTSYSVRPINLFYLQININARF